jgi:peptide/nickel transport system ATP-binding protein
VSEVNQSPGSSTEARAGQPPVLVVDDLRVDAPSGDPILEGVSFSIGRGEVLGVVGESGSGKTTCALALLGYTQSGARITGGSVQIGGEKMPTNNERGARRLRGRLCSYVPQNPGSALNPSMRIGDAIRDMIDQHRVKQSDPNVVSVLLQNVGLPDSTEFQRRYPHQLSGGQQQRVCISVALSCEPPLVVLDEPTTGLDVVTQAHILEELERLRAEREIAMLYVAHDLAVVAQVATSIAVMYAGRVIESGPAKEILSRPKHPYTRGLLDSIPDHLDPRELRPMPGVAVGVGERPKGCAFANRCALCQPACTEAVPELRVIDGTRRVRCIRAEEVRVSEAPAPAHARTEGGIAEPLLEVVDLRAEHRSRHETVVAAENVTFTLAKGRCIALVGESGSGKTTIARTVVGLHPLAAGSIRLHDQELNSNVRERSALQRRQLQIVFQNPADALNPRHMVREAIRRPLTLLRELRSTEANAEVDRLLELVRLPKSAARRYPHELSGGERQRVGIARALAPQPEIIVCDEVTSALDVSVQAAVLELLRNLRQDLGLTMLFITHDLGVVASIADEVLVLDRGQVVESGPTNEILRNPTAPYTQRLLESAPSISHALELWAAAESRVSQSDTPHAPATTS